MGSQTLTLLDRLLELSHKHHLEVQEAVEIHRLAVLSLKGGSEDDGYSLMMGSFENEAKPSARDVPRPAAEIQELASNPDPFDRFQPLCSTLCTKQPSAPPDDSQACDTPTGTHSSSKPPTECRSESETAGARSSISWREAAGKPADPNNAAKDLKIAQEQRNGFDTVIGVLVLLNAFVMVLDLECLGNQAGVDAELIGENAWSGFFPVVNVLEHCFAVAFLLELGYRVWTEGCKYFKECMNLFDTALVVVACLDLYLLTPLISSSSVNNNTSTLRLLRIIKLVRAIRIVRALRLFRGLRLLIQACSSFLPSLCWSMALLGLFMMMGALFMGNLLQDFILDPAEDKEMRRWVWLHYGTAYRAIYTMYEMTFAGNWPVYARPVLENVGHGFAIFYILYITFVVFAVIRVISAIFLRETLEAANNDAEMLVQDRLHKKAMYVRKLEGIFQACDESGDGVLTEDELTELMSDPRVQVYLESLEIDVQETGALFRLLQNGEGVISCDDFIDGILRCKGPARAIDQIILTNDVKQVAKSVECLIGLLGAAGVIPEQPGAVRLTKRKLEDELALMPAMQMTLSGRYIMS